MCMQLPQVRPCVSSASFVTLTASDGLAGSATTRPAPPLAPHPPTPSAIAVSSFKLSWASPLSRGAPVTEYLVSVQQPAAISDTNGHNSLAGAEPTTMSNGHGDANGNGVMDSMDDASSTSGSTAHVQVGGTKHLQSQGLRTPEPTCMCATQPCKHVYHASAYHSSSTCMMSTKWTLVAFLLCVRACRLGKCAYDLIHVGCLLSGFPAASARTCCADSQPLKWVQGPIPGYRPVASVI